MQIRLSVKVQKNPKYSDKIRHFGSTGISNLDTALTAPQKEKLSESTMKSPLALRSFCDLYKTKNSFESALCLTKEKMDEVFDTLLDEILSVIKIKFSVDVSVEFHLLMCAKYNVDIDKSCDFGI